MSSIIDLLKHIIVIGLFLILNLAHAQIEVSFEEAFPNLSFNFPVEMQGSVDGSNRIFVVEQPGIIKVFPNDRNVSSGQVDTYLDISSTVSYSSGQEIGLLGLAFHPNYASNGFVFVYYIDRPNNYRINIARYTVSQTNPNVLDTATGTIIAQFTKNQGDSNHNGGKIAFGPDGYLYISIGDGGGGGDPQGNGQNLNTVFGSLLRIDIDLDGNNPTETNPESPSGNYEIPSDNPRIGLSGLDELYAWGIRNTWKFSFDSSGNLWGADVGQNTYEEINLITRGGNYGWNRFEANAQPSYGSGTTLANSPDVKPILFYDHSAGDVSITGGYKYRGSLSNSSLQDRYIYGDYVSGRVWGLSYNSSTGATSNDLLFKTNGQFISSFGEDENGELYFLDYGSSVKVYRITGDNSDPEPTTVAVNGIGSWLNAGTNSVNGVVETIANDGADTFYVGGLFSQASGLTVSNLATYNKVTGWSTFSSGTNGKVSSIAIADNGTVYVGGEFSIIDGISVSNIAFWDGSNWNDMNGGTNGPVSKIKIDSNNTVYVGGAFETAGGINVNNIARWSSGNWSALNDATNGVAGTNNEIRSIAFDESNNLYIGGNFDTAGGNSAPRLAIWNGSNWSTLGNGTSGFVQGILIRPEYIYVGGNFSLAGSETVNRIARWNRSTAAWESLNNGLSGSANSLAHDGTYLYVGGTFETASDNTNVNEIMNNIARYSDTNGWEALGKNTTVGVGTAINALCFSSDDLSLYAGGNFSSAGEISAENIGIWNIDKECITSSITPEYEINGNLANGENEITIAESSSFSLGIVQDLYFQITLPDNSTVNGTYSISSASSNNSGTYTITSTEGCVETFILNVVPDSNADDDNDGISNTDDLCNDTPSGETVDANGCSESQLDTDGDGVNNSNDNCPNTPVGAIVSSDGCEITSLPVDQFSITSNGNSCVTTTNGRINVVAKSTGVYTAQLITIDESDSFQFTDSLEIEGLVAGEYTLCITAQDYSDYENCSKIVITAPQALEVDSVLDNELELNSVTLKMSGGSKYSISLNGRMTETEADEITLILDEDVNTIKVSTGLTCQGVYEETIVLKNTVILYPNPATDFVAIDLSHINLETVRISLYSESGVQLSSNQFVTTEGTATLNTSSLAKGIYFIRVKNEEMDKALKLIKL